ncbi:uncharacterized protein I303_102093 [Kwoniella dejecticola CBS 10117]|uniref:Solute carrier family 41 n=1 Tax=Kwoniella dejecticola CBS 10117 TaxID=1296121 RepID=A0A1A6ABZ1_9TREE|nr:solute carrier family 41 [Kwoniella dejecticola CBS 10117]OBR87558.1 solute carrier family 41 [Kwoniella dejecticola CBS 10117]
MSPILKRDLSEQYRQAKRIASLTLGTTSNENLYDEYSSIEANDNAKGEGSSTSGVRRDGYSSSSSARQGIGVDRIEDESAFPPWRGSTSATTTTTTTKTPSNSNGNLDDLSNSSNGKGKSRAIRRDVLPHSLQLEQAEAYELASLADEAEVNQLHVKRSDSIDSHLRSRSRLDCADPLSGDNRRLGKWKDLRRLLLESTPSLLLSLVGLVFTGELLEHLARWRVFQRVDELFILVPMIGNLKGNLEMCLSARLGTSANIGELDNKKIRKSMILSNLTLLGLQALLISSLAALISFGLGWITIHRLGDSPTSQIPVEPERPGLEVAGDEWHEGYTRPGFKQLVMVLATGMGAAGISSAVLGSFMGSLIVLARWWGADPDNITPPVAACLGDLLTLFILALLGTALVGAMDTVIPLLAVIVMSIAAGWFTRRVMRNEWIKNVAKGGWIPLIGAMLISSGTGMVLAKGVGKYRGFALLAISMTGLTGSIGAIHANRLSTSLHTLLHPKPHPEYSLSAATSISTSSKPLHEGLSPLQSAITLYLIAFPCQAAFLLFVSWAGWIDLNLGWVGWCCFALTTAVSLVLAHHMTLFFWSKDLDPDSYTLPIHSALVDFLGQLLLMLAYEICIWQGKDVIIKPET